MFRLIEALEDLDDVQNVFGNFDVSDEVMESLGGERRRSPAGHPACPDHRSGPPRLASLLEQVFGREGCGMRVLGIDPGLTRCGLGVVDGSVGRRFHLVDVGVARTDPAQPTALRLCEIERAVDAWLEQHRPDAVAIEQIAGQHNACAP